MGLGSVYQLLTFVGLVVGIVLVLYELQQTRQLTQAQLNSENWQRLIGLHTATMGDEVAESLAKDCTSSGQMTDADRVRVTAYLENIVGHVYHQYSLDIIAGFPDSLGGAIYHYGKLFLSQPLGRQHLEDRSIYLDDPVREKWDQILQEQSYYDCRTRWQIPPLEDAKEASA